MKTFGIVTHTTKSSIKIWGNPKIKRQKQIKIPSTLDHRIQMSFCILSLITDSNVLIKGFETVSTSFPSFLKLLKELKAKYEIKK